MVKHRNLVVILTIVVVIVVVAAISANLLHGPAASKSTTTTASSALLPITTLEPAVDVHIDHLNSRNVTLIVSDYTSDAVVNWSGITGGMGGIYSGTVDIKILFAGSFASAESISLTVNSYEQKIVNSTTALALFNMTMNGNSSVLGKFEAKINAATYYVSIADQWKIASEYWDYLEMGGTSLGGATTFPQWHTPPRQSPDAFKNFAFNYGGTAYTFIIFCYTATLVALFFAMISRRRQDQRNGR